MWAAPGTKVRCWAPHDSAPFTLATSATLHFTPASSECVRIAVCCSFRELLFPFKNGMINTYTDDQPVLSTMSTSLKHGEQISSALRLLPAGARPHRASLLRVPPPPPLVFLFTPQLSFSQPSHYATGKTEWPTCGIKLSIFLIHNRPRTTRPTGPADWFWGGQTLPSNPKENTRTLHTSGCHSAATRQWIRVGIKVTVAIVLQQVLDRKMLISL